MNTLFDSYTHFPPGFEYFPNFLSEAEEHELLEAISRIRLKNFQFHGFEAKRKIASFGFDYHFDSGMLSAGEPIPTFFTVLIEKVAKHTAIPAADFKELLVTEYPVGSVINWHRDAPPFDAVAGISLLSDCLFHLRRYHREQRSRATSLSFPVNRRSLYIIQGEARSAWQHRITPVKQPRFSITLRTLKN